MLVMKRNQHTLSKISLFVLGSNLVSELNDFHTLDPNHRMNSNYCHSNSWYPVNLFTLVNNFMYIGNMIFLSCDNNTVH